MSDKLQFYIDHMRLTVFPDSFLIQVSRVDDPPRQDRLEDFPKWAFRSKNAIWFLQEDGPYRRRAVDGDKIKHQLMQKLK